MPKIGEGWIRETNLYYSISKEFSDYEVIQHHSPKWLGKQHLDIYFPNENFPIEYQGAQHYTPIDFFGGQEAFEKTIEGDKRKRRLCLKNNCSLIYVNEGYSKDEVFEEIRIGINNGLQ